MSSSLAYKKASKIIFILMLLLFFILLWQHNEQSDRDKNAHHIDVTCENATEFMPWNNESLRNNKTFSSIHDQFDQSQQEKIKILDNLKVDTSNKELIGLMGKPDREILYTNHKIAMRGWNLDDQQFKTEVTIFNEEKCIVSITVSSLDKIHGASILFKRKILIQDSK